MGRDRDTEEAHFDWAERDHTDRLGLEGIVRVIRRRRFAFASTFLLALGAVGAFALLRPATHSATALVIVSPYSDIDSSQDAALRASAVEELKITTVEEILKSRKIAQQLAVLLSDTENGADITKDDVLSAGATLLTRLSSPAVAADAVGAAAHVKSEEERARELEATTDAIIGAVSFKRLRTSRLIEVSATARSPESAASLANSLVEVFLESQRRDQKRHQAKKIERFRALAESAQKELYSADLATAKYMRKNNLLGADSTPAMQGRVASLETAVANAEAESVSRQLNQLLDAQEALQDRLASLSVIYGSGYPEVADLTAKLDILAGDIAIERASVADELRDRRAQVGASAQALSQELRAVRRKHFDSLEANAGLNELERAAAAKLEVFNSLVERVHKAEADIGNYRDELEFVTRASATTAEAAGSSVNKVLAVGSVGALMIAFLAALAGEGLDRNIRSSEHVRQHLGAPTLSLVPESRLRRSDAKSVQEFVRDHPSSEFSEAIRNLFLELLSKPSEARPRVIVTTSLNSGDGKSTIAYALAEIATQFNHRAMVFALDRRHLLEPASGDAAGGHGERRRGWNWLKGSRNALVSAEGARNLPVEVGAGVHLRDFNKQITELRGQWDMVIVETPPILKSRDAKALAAYASEILVVLEWGEASPSALRAVRRIFGDLDNVAAVINKVDFRAHARRGYGDPVEFRR